MCTCGAHGGKGGSDPRSVSPEEYRELTHNILCNDDMYNVTPVFIVNSQSQDIFRPI